MATNTPINAIPVPENADPPNMANSINPMASTIDSRLVARFTTTTARDSSVTAPTGGMICYVSGDSCYYVHNGADWIKMFGAQKGQESVSFTTQSSFTVAVTFPVEFIATPTVITNIQSSTGATNKWISRAYGVSGSGFTLWVFTGDASTATWSSVPVDWVAIGF